MGTYNINKNGQPINAQQFDDSLLAAMGLEKWINPLLKSIGTEVEIFFLDGDDLVRSRIGDKTTWKLQGLDLVPERESTQYIGWCIQTAPTEKEIMIMYESEDVYGKFKKLFLDFFDSAEYIIHISFRW